MTRLARKRLLIAATASTQLILLAHLGVLLFVFIAQDSLIGNPEISTLIPSGGLNPLLLNLALQAALCSGILLGLYLFFRKTPSAEVFFFQFALLGFAVSSLRVLTLPMVLQVTSLFSLQPLSKIILFGRFFSILCLFLSGLFSTGLTFQKQGGYLLIVFVIALIISNSPGCVRVGPWRFSTFFPQDTISLLSFGTVVSLCFLVFVACEYRREPVEIRRRASIKGAYLSAVLLMLSCAALWDGGATVLTLWLK